MKQRLARLRSLFAIALLALATPSQAERLQFDHRLYPPLQQVLDAGDQGMVDFNNKNPARLVDLIAVKGSSAQNWTEAMEIVSIVRPAKVADAREWMAVIESQAQERCPTTFEVIAQDEISVTFERRSPGCQAVRANFALYRLVTGKRSWFQLTVLSKEELDFTARQQWLKLLASAHME